MTYDVRGRSEHTNFFFKAINLLLLLADFVLEIDPFSQKILSTISQFSVILLKALQL